MRTRLLDRIPTLGVTLASVLAVVLAAPRASAQEGGAITECPELAVGCHESELAFHYREGFFDSFSYDTGWIPSGSPLQVRFAIAGGGETEIDLAGRSLVWWPAPLSVAIPGLPGTGRLSIDYGLEIVAKIRFDVTIAGVRYNWEGDIPIPGGIPRDLRLAAMTGFDSMLLPPMLPRPVVVADTTSPIRFEVDLTDSIIPIPGIGGGLAVELTPRLEAAYQTTRIEIGDAMVPITSEGGATVAVADEGATGFGAAKDVVVTPFGELDYDGTVGLGFSLYISFPGGSRSLPLGSVDVPLVDLDREVEFGSQTVHVPLPDVRIESREVDFGEVEVGSSASRVLEVHNDGELELVVTPRAAREPFAITSGSVVVPPRSSRRVELVFAPTEPGPSGAMLFLDTNDPDESLVVIRLSGTGLEAPMLDGGVGDAGVGPGTSTSGGCACRASGVGGASPAGALGLAAVVGIALVVRRRRR